MRLHRLLAAFLLLPLVAPAAEGPLFLEVRNPGPRLYQHVVEHRAPRGELLPDANPRSIQATETNAKGHPIGPAVAQLDVQGDQAVLSLLLDGVTERGQRRYFQVKSAKPDQSRATTDLRVDEADGTMLLSNQYFTAHVKQTGGGGFPHAITFNGSGNHYENFYWGDRLYTKERGTRELQTDPKSTTTVLARGPLRVVLQAKARYGAPGRYASGDAQALYRWVYRAYSPIVEVTTTARRSDDYRWSEIQYLHVSRDDPLFGHWLGGQPLKRGRFTDSSTGEHLPKWGVMHNADDAIGLAHPRGITLFDGVTEYFNYLKCPTHPWTERTYENHGRLYFGPAQRDPQRYARLLVKPPSVTVRRLPLPQPAKPPAAVQYRLKSNALALEFAGEDAGLGLVRLSNALTDEPLVASAEEKPLLWRIEFRSQTEGAKPLTLDNRAEAEASASLEDGTLTLKWHKLDLPDEPDAVDVTATVTLPPKAALSQWRIQVDCRSTRYGVWDVFFPAVAKVGPDQRPDVAVPRSNWGMLYRNCMHRQAGTYPSCRWPMQFLTANRGDTGLYLACHDPGAMPKRFSLSPLGEFHFQVHAPNQGVAGSGYEQPFPIVLGAYRGDWWRGAKLYRNWALENAPWTQKGPLATRKSTPKSLRDLGLWMLGGGHPKSVVPKMKQAAALFSVPIGIHWYNWHEIPFDTYYPNYFPTKPGFAEAAAELTDGGMVVMPYINGRLWDSGNQNFKTALPFACKKPDGEPYIERYGSKRPLAVMCPATKFWQDKVVEICRRLMTEQHVNAIYIDQIAAAGPRLCYDESHGHPIGGGTWWVDGYRKMLARIQTLAHSDGRDVIITTENNTESYMDGVDAFLTWNPRYDHEIPMLPAVYSGRTVYFSSPCNVGDSLTAFAMSEGRDWLWGCQLGWMGFELLEEKNREKAQYLDDLAAHRLVARDFMLDGELLGEVKPLNDIPEITVTWRRRRPHEATLPAVMATLWRARDGRLAVAMTNWSDETQVVQIRPRSVLGKTQEPRLLVRVTADGTRPYEYVDDPAQPLKLVLVPRDVLVLTARPAPSREKALAAVAEERKRSGPPPAEPVLPPTDVDLRIAGSLRAGEDCAAIVAVTRHASTAVSPAIALRAPADWGIEPGRRLRLPNMQPGETRVVSFLCHLPRDALVGRTRISVGVVEDEAAEHIEVQPPRPQATAPHRNGAPTIDGDLADWRKYDPIVLNSRNHVKVEKWRGAADCSARLWTGWNAEHLFVAA
jgi:hypothetical protein